MDHKCTPGCPHWCDKSLTERHHWDMDLSTPSTSAQCRYCKVRRRFDGGVGSHYPSNAQRRSQSQGRSTTKEGEYGSQS